MWMFMLMRSQQVDGVEERGDNDNNPSAVPDVRYVVQDVNNDHVHILPATSSSSGQASTAQRATYSRTFIPQIILSCFVLWLFGFLFGFIALILARGYTVYCCIFAGRF